MFDVISKSGDPLCPTVCEYNMKDMLSCVDIYMYKRLIQSSGTPKKILGETIPSERVYIVSHRAEATHNYDHLRNLQLTARQKNIHIM